MTTTNIILPSIPNYSNLGFKHYYIVRDKAIETTYYLYLLEYEPVSMYVDGNGYIVARHKYGKAINMRLYYTSAGYNSWISYGSGTAIHKYSNFTDALVFNNFSINLEEEDFASNPMPDDRVVPVPELNFPAIPNLDPVFYKQYFIRQSKEFLYLYELYILTYEPVSMEIDVNDNLVFYRKYGKKFDMMKYTYRPGDTSWYKNGTAGLKYNDLKDSLMYNNFIMKLGNDEYQNNPLPDDQLQPALEPEFPIIPHLSDFHYKQYFIKQNKDYLNRYELYFLAYEPASMIIDESSCIRFFQKYGKAVEIIRYDYQIGQQTWNRGGSTTVKYNELEDALIYNNFRMDFGDTCYEENPLPDDQLKPAMEPEFPAIPYVSNFHFKQYYIVQNKTYLNRYELYLLTYEPMHMEISDMDYITAYQKYGKLIEFRRYDYQIGENAWRIVGTSINVHKFSEFKDALIYNNFRIDLGDVCYEENPLPDDQLVPALEPDFPAIPNNGNFNFKQYYIVQDKNYLNQYELYIWGHEPVSMEINNQDYIMAYHQYGLAIPYKFCRYQVGDKNWTSSSGESIYAQTYSKFKDALIYNNFTIDFGFDYYLANPLPDDQVEPVPELQFPPIPKLAQQDNTYRHYIITQHPSILNRYYVYVLSEKPADYELLYDGSHVRFLNGEGQVIYMQSCEYNRGDMEWGRFGPSYSFNIKDLNESLVYCNFDIAVRNPQSGSGSDYLCKIPGNSYKNDGTGIAPIYRNGLTEQNGEHYYYVDGVKQKGDGGWLQINDGRTRTNNRVLYADGIYNWAIAKGRRMITKGETYYLKPDGNLARGVEEIYGDSYSFGPTTGKLLKMISGTDTYTAARGTFDVRASYSDSSELLLIMIDPPKIKVPLPKDIQIGADNELWIEIYYEDTYIGPRKVKKKGWVKLKELVPYYEPTEGSDDFESDLKSQGFTECYIKHLMKLHEKYPKWKFEAIITSVDYEQFVNYQVTNKFKCAEISQNPQYCTAEQFTGEDSKDYYVATKEAIRYFSHPYSMLYTDEKLTYENALQFLKAKQKLSKSYTDTIVTSILYDKSTDIIDKIKNYSGSINPIFLSCVIAGETGPIGESYNGKLVYNLFNFGAKSGKDSGKKYAYDKSWFSLDDCINACEAEFSVFFNGGQETLYSLDWHFQAFGSGGAVKQYATLVNDAENKAIMMAKRNNVQFDLDQEFVLSIPVYNNIPTYNNQPCEPFPDPNW